MQSAKNGIIIESVSTATDKAKEYGTVKNPSDQETIQTAVVSAKKTQKICVMNQTAEASGNADFSVPPCRIAAVTHAGFRRNANEDCYGYHISHNDTVRLLAVADGIGGHGNGDHASNLLIRELLNFWRKHCDSFDITQWEIITNALKKQLTVINERLHEINDAIGIKVPMGSTLALLLLLPGKAITLHAGDSRIYRLREQEFTPLTEDHSYITEFLKSGTLTKEKAADHPLAHVILRSIGTLAHVDIEINTYDLKDGDSFVVCSDGLTEHLNDDMIRNIMIHNSEPADVVKELLQETLRNGAHDNVTALYTKYQ